MAKLLTNASIRALKIGSRMRGGDGLFAENDKGVRYFGFRYADPTQRGRYREQRLGRWRDSDDHEGLTIAEARAKVAELRGRLAKGIDPKAKVPTKAFHSFGEVSEVLIASKIDPVSKRGRQGDQWRQSFRDYANKLMPMDVATITVDDVLAVLQTIWLTMNPTASRLRGRIERVFSYARARGWREAPNPALWRDHLEHTLAAPTDVYQTKPHRARDWRDAQALIAALRASPRIRARMAEFCVLAATRTRPVIEMRWREINLDRMIWNVPAVNEKTGKPLRVPLTHRMVEILLEQQHNDCEPDDVVFHSPDEYRGRKAVRGRNTMLHELGDLDTTTHGLRRMFRSWVKARGYKRELGEEALSHSYEGKVEGTYTGDEDMLEERREMMRAWSDYLAGAEIIPLLVKHAA
jgi:integrase